MTGIRLGGFLGLSEYPLGEQVIFSWICHAAAHSFFTMERNIQVNCKVYPQYISYCKIPEFLLMIFVTFCRIKGLCVLQ